MGKSGLRGFVRDKVGNYTSFDPPGSEQTVPQSINSSGQITGIYTTSVTSLDVGFLRDSPISAGINSAMLGEKDQAFSFLEKAYETRQGIIWLKVEPMLDNIRSDPRYADLMRRTGLSQ
jgi:hypothetical protein